MGSDALVSRNNGNVIDQSWFNLFQSVLKGDIVPRNGFQIVGDVGASLGDATYPWKRIKVASGHWKLGDIKFRHSYGATLTPPEGWMLCDGRAVNQANYDTEHGAGAWDSHVVSSGLQDKLLPNLVNRYPVGAASTPQDGSVTITPVGNPSHLSSFAHVHQFYINNGTVTTHQSFDSLGNPANIGIAALKSGTLDYFNAASAQVLPALQSAWTDSSGATVTIQPDSIQALPYMRII